VAHHAMRSHVSMRAVHHMKEALRAYASVGPSFATATQRDESQTPSQTAASISPGRRGGRPAA
jgi:hypothetical protein